MYVCMYVCMCIICIKQVYANIHTPFTYAYTSICASAAFEAALIPKLLWGGGEQVSTQMHMSYVPGAWGQVHVKLRVESFACKTLSQTLQVPTI